MLLADVMPPADLSGYVGSLVIGSLATTLVTRFFKGSDKAEADLKAAEAKAEAERKAAEVRAEAERKAVDSEFRLEMRSDLKRLLDGQQALSSTQALQAKDLSQFAGSLAALEKRQDSQAEAHRDAVRSLRAEFEARLRGAP